MREIEFERNLVKDLQERSVSVHGLGEGRLDLYFEDLGILGEVKSVGTGLAGGMAYRNAKTISSFTKEQTSLIRKLRKKPIVIAFDDEKKEYFFYKPEQVKKLFEARKEHKKVFWSKKAKESPFEHSLPYEDLLSAVADYVKRRR